MVKVLNLEQNEYDEDFNSMLVFTSIVEDDEGERHYLSFNSMGQKFEIISNAISQYTSGMITIEKLGEILLKNGLTNKIIADNLEELNTLGNNVYSLMGAQILVNDKVLAPYFALRLIEALEYSVIPNESLHHNRELVAVNAFIEKIYLNISVNSDEEDQLIDAVSRVFSSLHSNGVELCLTTEGNMVIKTRGFINYGRYQILIQNLENNLFDFTPDSNNSNSDVNFYEINTNLLKYIDGALEYEGGFNKIIDGVYINNTVISTSDSPFGGYLSSSTPSYEDYDVIDPSDVIEGDYVKFSHAGEDYEGTVNAIEGYDTLYLNTSDGMRKFPLYEVESFIRYDMVNRMGENINTYFAIGNFIEFSYTSSIGVVNDIKGAIEQLKRNSIVIKNSTGSIEIDYDKITALC